MQVKLVDQNQNSMTGFLCWIKSQLLLVDAAVWYWMYSVSLVFIFLYWSIWYYRKNTRHLFFFGYCRLFGILSLGWRRRLVLHLHGSCGSGIDYVIYSNWTEREWLLCFIKILYMTCRYSTFLLLYPTGITSEVGLIYVALPFIQVTILMMQKSNTSFANAYVSVELYTS